MINTELQLLDQDLFELKHFGEHCVDPSVEQTVGEVEDMIFTLKVSVSSLLKDIEETRSSSGRTSRFEKTRSSRRSEISRNSDASSRSARSGSPRSSNASKTNKAKMQLSRLELRD